MPNFYNEIRNYHLATTHSADSRSSLFLLCGLIGVHYSSIPMKSQNECCVPLRTRIGRFLQPAGWGDVTWSIMPGQVVCCGNVDIMVFVVCQVEERGKP